MIVKGIAEALQQPSAPFTVLSSGNADTVELELSGLITKQETAQGLKRWLKGQEKKILSVSGKVVDKKTGDVVFHFVRSLEGKTSSSFDDIGYQLGQDIGRFILSQTQM